MKPEDVRKLIGGYAMGTLTEQERRALLEAALSDQELFDELAREQPLKDLLEDPLARRALLNAVEEQRQPAVSMIAWWKRPATWALAGGLATAAMLVAIFVRPTATNPKPETVLMAKREAAPVPTPVESAPRAATETRAKVKAPEPARSRPPSSAEPEQPREPERADEAKVEMAEASPPAAQATAQPMGAARPEAQPMMDAMRQAPAEAEQNRAMKMTRTSSTLGAAAGGLYRAGFAAQPPVVPYRLLRGDAAGSFSETAAATVFQKGDLVRVAFEPKQSGRLVVASGASKTVLLDVNVTASDRANADVPPGESRLLVTFTRTGEATPAPYEVQIRRE